MAVDSGVQGVRAVADRSKANEPEEREYARRKRLRGLREDLTSFWFLLPILAVFVILFAVPLVQTAIYSVTDFNGYSMDMHYVGWSNYRSVFTDPSTMQGLVFTIVYALAQTILVTVFAIPLAVTLNRKFWGRNFARSLFFFFSVPSLAIIGTPPFTWPSCNPFPVTFTSRPPWTVPPGGNSSSTSPCPS